MAKKKKASKPKETIELKRQKMRSDIEGLLQPALDADGEIDRDSVRETSPALADVLDEFALTKSDRTDPKGSAKLISQALEARDENTALAQALAKLEEELGSGAKK